MQPGQWEVKFYADWRGREPVTEFLNSLDPKARGRALALIDHVQKYNISAQAPYVKHIDGKLWEMRIQVSANSFRIFYFTASGRRIILLHGFQKKTQKTPSREIETARQRLADFLERDKD